MPAINKRGSSYYVFWGGQVIRMSDYLLKYIDEENHKRYMREDEPAARLPKRPIKKEERSERPKSAPLASREVRPKGGLLAPDAALHAIVKARGQPQEEIVVPPFPQDPERLINKSVILYGGSGSGKTTIVRHFMYLSRHLFPMVHVFAPTEQETQSYEEVPPAMIHDELSLDRIKKIYLRQAMAAGTYKKANTIKVLASLFSRVADRETRHCESKIYRYYERALAKAEERGKFKAREEKRRIAEVFESRITRFYKRVICSKLHRLEDCDDLDKKERFALTYLSYNPRVLVIYDDAQLEIMALLKLSNKVRDITIKNFFFKGRHKQITHFYCLQDDSGFDPALRKNAFISIFTTKQIACAWFKRDTNSFTPEERKRAMAVADAIFAEENEARHLSMVYSRLDRTKYYYLEVDDHPAFEMCSRAVRKYCDKITEIGDTLDVDNPFYEAFNRVVERD